MPKIHLQDLSLLLTIISLASTDDGQFPSFQDSPAQHIQYSDPHYSLADSDDSAIAEARGSEWCKFPVKWEGNWFQSGGGSDTAISITRSTINTKGRCLEADGEKYLIFNEREYCYRCLVFHEKHYNVLQYKETFCVSERRLIKDFCSTISGDANLHAMFRLDAVPIECPFKGPYTFTYNRGHKDCRYPASTVEPCIQSSRVQLNFQACPDLPGSESKSEELQCLATWREGSSRYLLGLIKYNHPASFEERFRCFVYEKTNKKYVPILSSNGTENAIFRLAQSGDATCNGLSLNEFSRMMTLKKSPSPKPCQFPSWLHIHTQWHTLDQRSTFVFDSSSGLLVYNASDLSGVGPNSLTMTAICSQILENPTLSKVMLILHATADCNSGYICAAIYRRDGHIVEIQIGNTARKADDACHHHYFNQTELPYTTLVSSTPETRQCPNVGRFQVTGFIREGRQLQGKCASVGTDSLNVGCSSLDTLQIRSECYSSDLSSDYACHGNWEELGVSYLIATPLSRASTAARRYCFIFRESTDFRIQQRFKSSSNMYKFSDSTTPFDQNDLLTNGHRRLLHFSTVADSCRRNLVPGIEGTIAFNVTEHGRCNDLNGAPQLFQNSLRNSYQLVILVLIGSLLCPS